MDILTCPLPDDALCESVLEGNLSKIERNAAILSPTITFSRTMTLAISIKNITALKLLFELGGQVCERVAEAAAISEEIEIVKIVLDRGWDVDCGLRGGVIPSMLSFAIRNLGFLDWPLLEMHADPNVVSTLNESCLTFAIREGNLEVVKRLLNLEIEGFGVDVRKGDLLHAVAARKDVVFLVDVLVQRGLQVNCYQFDNDVARILRYGYPLGTPLHVACRERNLFAIRALLGHGADPDCLKKRRDELVGPTPRQIAERDEIMMKIFEEYDEGRKRSG